MRECNEFHDYFRILLLGTDHFALQWGGLTVGALILFALLSAANMLEQTPIHQFVCIFHNALKLGAFVRKSTSTQQHPRSLHAQHHQGFIVDSEWKTRLDSSNYQRKRPHRARKGFQLTWNVVDYKVSLNTGSSNETPPGKGRETKH